MHVVKVQLRRELGFVSQLRTPLRLNCIAAATSTDWLKTSDIFRVLTLKESRWNLSQALRAIKVDNTSDFIPLLN